MASGFLLSWFKATRYQAEFGKLQNSSKRSESDEARQIIAGVERDSERIGFSAMDNLARPPEDDSNDPIVILGKKIGRILAYVALALMLVYLGFTWLS